MNQLFIAVFGLTSIWFAMGHNATLRKWAPIIGLCGQPFWAWFAYQSNAWGLAVLVSAYTLVYMRGAILQWRAA
jgi:hypothetical protein